MKLKNILFLLFITLFNEVILVEDAQNDSIYNKDRKQAPYPEIEAGGCNAWALTDNVCCGSYCDNLKGSEGCDGCGGLGSEHCVVDDSSCCKSGVMDDVHPGDFGVMPEDWRYSRSTHFGITIGGACGFGPYQACGTNLGYTGDTKALCDAFCKNYPDLCTDPEGMTYRGNFAAPPGHYYTQFWGALEGDRDNYLSCGECFEVVKTKPDGTDYEKGEEGYQAPVILSIVDSCPCSANTKWCCGSGYDQCQEADGWKYGCPIPKNSMHLDLSDAAMARLQTGNPETMIEGIIPIRYKRVPCPAVGNLFLWLREGSGPYYIAFTIVNAAGHGSVVIVEMMDDNGNWVKMVRDPNYTSARPQERYGTWAIPQGSGPFTPPLNLRLTDGNKEVLTIEEAIPSFDIPEDAIKGYYYIDLGVNFPEMKTDYSNIDP